MSAAAAGTIRLGELEVSRLGYGAMRITGPGIWGEPADPDGAVAVLRRAVELGVDFIDTANSYGPGVSEELIARALAFYGDVVIATKAGLTRSGPGAWSPNGRPEHIRSELEGSLRRLRLERIDLFQFHRPDPDVPFAESMGAFAAAQQEGKVRHIGLSNVSVAQLQEALLICEIVSVQNRYSVSDRESQDVLEACTARGIAFIPWSPLAAGSHASAGGALERVARAHGASSGQVALAWLLAASPMMLPIPGTSSVEHLEENVGAGALSLSGAQLDELNSAAL
ncbi:MAG TPA: aldo/keto reductase [Solirubrobacteraceae bacterium]|jgi:aryl-alcohol dehydrogenase-like predicted oxidoreductase